MSLNTTQRETLQSKVLRFLGMSRKGVRQYHGKDEVVKAINRAMRWAKNNPGVPDSKAPHHIREKLLVLGDLQRAAR